MRIVEDVIGRGSEGSGSQSALNTILLSNDAHDRLRGRFFIGSDGRRVPALDLLTSDLMVDEVRVLSNGWIWTRVVYDRSEIATATIEIMLPPWLVIAIHSEIDGGDCIGG